jgi:hypothetical protein
MTLMLLSALRDQCCLFFSLSKRVLRVDVLLEATERLLLEGLHQAHNFIEVLRERQLREAQRVEDVIH